MVAVPGNVLGFSGSTTAHLGPIDFDWGSLIIVGGITLVLAIGTKVSSRVSAVITAIKIAVVLLVITVGVFYIKKENYAPYIPPAEATRAPHTVSTRPCSPSSPERTAAATLVRPPRRREPRVLRLHRIRRRRHHRRGDQGPAEGAPPRHSRSLAIVTVLYVAVTLVLTGMVKYTDLKTGSPLVGDSSATLATAFEAHGITWAQTAINFGGLAGLTTVVMVMMLGQTRVLFAMSRDGLVPRGLAKTGKKAPRSASPCSSAPWWHSSPPSSRWAHSRRW